MSLSVTNNRLSIELTGPLLATGFSAVFVNERIRDWFLQVSRYILTLTLNTNEIGPINKINSSFIYRTDLNRPC